MDETGSARAEWDEGTLLDRLTPREYEILVAMSGGGSTVDIARDLSISPLTVQSHVKSILVKLGVHSKIEAVVMALRDGAKQTKQAGSP